MRPSAESEDERSESNTRSQYIGDDDYRERSSYERDKKEKKERREKKKEETRRGLRRMIKDKISAVIHHSSADKEDLERQRLERVKERIEELYADSADWDQLEAAVTEQFREDVEAQQLRRREKKEEGWLDEELARRLDLAKALHDSEIKEELIQARNDRLRKERLEEVEALRQKYERELPLLEASVAESEKTRLDWLNDPRNYRPPESRDRDLLQEVRDKWLVYYQNNLDIEFRHMCYSSFPVWKLRFERTMNHPDTWHRLRIQKHVLPRMSDWALEREEKDTLENTFMTTVVTKEAPSPRNLIGQALLRYFSRGRYKIRWRPQICETVYRFPTKKK